MEGVMREEFLGDERAALSYIPDRCADAVRKTAALYGGVINEIRLRSEGVLSVTVMGENIPTGIRVTGAECDETLLRLCRRSVYSEAENINEGFVTTAEGIRAGICGRATVKDGKILSVYGAGAICIRIPRRAPGAGDECYRLFREMGMTKSILVWSRPGVGKTTLLRELAVRLATDSPPVRVAVVDTRYELGAGIKGIGLIDLLEGYPRGKGIEIAKRTMSPQVIICDEIGCEEDTAAVLDAAFCGIPVVATAHASTREGVLLQKHLRPLTSSDTVGAYLGLVGRIGGRFLYDICRCDSGGEGE